MFTEKQISLKICGTISRTLREKTAVKAIFSDSYGCPDTIEKVNLEL
jgi:hypothetical protein